MAIVKIPSRFKVTAFSNNCLLFVLMGKGIFVGTEWQFWASGELSMLHHEQTSAGQEMHPLNKLLVNILASNVVDGLFL